VEALRVEGVEGAQEAAQNDQLRIQKVHRSSECDAQKIKLTVHLRADGG
jgi:hypothetical protein